MVEGTLLRRGWAHSGWGRSSSPQTTMRTYDNCLAAGNSLLIAAQAEDSLVRRAAESFGGHAQRMTASMLNAQITRPAMAFVIKRADIAREWPQAFLGYGAVRHVGLLVTPAEEKALLQLAEATGKAPDELLRELLIRGFNAYTKDMKAREEHHEANTDGDHRGFLRDRGRCNQRNDG